MKTFLLTETIPTCFHNMQIKFVEGGHALYLEPNAALYNSVAPFLRKYSNKATILSTCKTQKPLKRGFCVIIFQ